MAKVIVHHFQNVYLEVEGKKYHVSTVNIMLQENSIPFIRAVIDPAHVDDIPAIGDFDSPDAIAATLAKIVSWHKDFQEWSVQKKAANFHMEVWTKEDPEESADGELEQELDLKNWIITGSGITGASAAGNFALEIEITHPFTLADFAPAQLSAFQGLVRWDRGDLAAGVDIPSTMQEVMKQYYEIDAVALPAPFCFEEAPDLDSIRQTLRKNMEAAADAFQTYLVWAGDEYSGLGDKEYSKLPMTATCLEDKDDWIKLALADYVTGMPEATPYELLVQSICPEFGVVLVPTFWKDQLELRPFSPWLRPAVELESIDIADLVFPGTDPSPLAGVVKQYQTVESAADWSIMLKGDGSFDQFIKDEIAFIPERMLAAGGGEATIKEWSGRILHGAPARWIGSAGLKEGSSGGERLSPRPAEEAGKRSTSMNVKPGTTASTETATSDFLDAVDRLRGAVWRDAKSTFITKFRQNVQCVVRCRLLMKSYASIISAATDDMGRGWIIPSHVYRILDTTIDDEGTSSSEAVFDFYCTSVVHSIDCQANSVITELQGRYVRPMIDANKSGFEGILVSGDTNPMWEM